MMPSLVDSRHTTWTDRIDCVAQTVNTKAHGSASLKTQGPGRARSAERPEQDATSSDRGRDHADQDEDGKERREGCRANATSRPEAAERIDGNTMAITAFEFGYRPRQSLRVSKIDGNVSRPAARERKGHRNSNGSNIERSRSESQSGCSGCQHASLQDKAEGHASLDTSPDAIMPAASPPQTRPPSLSQAGGDGTTKGPLLERVHDLQHDSSVLAVAVNHEYIFTGTHDGEILIWSLGQYQLVQRIQAHKRSVLCLFLTTGECRSESSQSKKDQCEDEKTQLLVSSAGDAIISIWSSTTFQRLYEIYSTYDVGDIFSIAYSVQNHILYIGAQDTSIQWVDLEDPRRRALQDAHQHPDKRHHRFFDSKAVSGSLTPRRNEEHWSLIPKAETVIEVHPSAIHQFAHFGYVYCMLVAKGPVHNLGADDDVLISGGGDGTVKLWKIGAAATEDAEAAEEQFSDEDGDVDEVGGGIREVMTLGRDDAMSVLSLAVDGSFLYCGKLDGLVELWDLDTRQKLRVIKAHTDDVMTLQMHWGYLWSASANGFAAKHSTVHYDGTQSQNSLSNQGTQTPNTQDTVSQKYQCISRWKAHNGKILSSTATTLDSSRLYITAANDQTVSIWRVPDRCDTAQADTAAVTEDVMLQNLRDFISYKTVSSRPEFAEDCHRGATFLCTLFKRLGGEVQMLLAKDQGHNPVVYAKFAGNKGGEGGQKAREDATAEKKRKRILFYGHYDVVAADTKKGKWTTDPFAMKGTNGYLYGRGVSDNKGPIMAALYAVADLKQEQKLESDIIFLIEGEEESGSTGFRETVREHQALIGPIDYILLANSYWLDDDTPCLTYGLRGVLHATVSVDSPHPDLHSGVDGSYLMAEPLSDLTAVLAQLKGRQNRIRIPHFYDGVLPLRPDEEARFDTITRMLVQQQKQQMRRQFAVEAESTKSTRSAGSVGSAGSAGSGSESEAELPVDSEEDAASAAVLKASLISRWREPNLTIHRYKVSGPDGSLVSSHACANISLRLVPGQEVDDVIASLKAFLADEFAQLQSPNQFSVQIDNKAEPWLGDPDNYIFRTLEKAIVDVWGMDGGEDEETGKRKGKDKEDKKDRKGKEGLTKPTKPYKARRPLYIREGGSIPAIRFLEKQFGAPAAHMPCGQASDAAHLDNERLRVDNLIKSRAIFKHVFQKL